MNSSCLLYDFFTALFVRCQVWEGIDLVQLYLCRDALDTRRKVLPPHSLIVIGGIKGFWPTREKRLARKLRRFGHEVIFAETD